jgi:hypothetical protein
LGETTSYAKGDIVPLSEFKGKGIFGGDIAYQDMGLEERISANISNPSSYRPIVTGVLSGALNDPPKYEEPPPRPPVDDGFGDYTLEGGTPREPKTQEELLAIALGGGREKMFEDSYYDVMIRNAAEGGIVGLQQGGMATPQAPSAMSAMLAPPMQQQQQPMQQPMPMQYSMHNLCLCNSLCSNSNAYARCSSTTATGYTTIC